MPLLLPLVLPDVHVERRSFWQTIFLEMDRPGVLHKHKDPQTDIEGYGENGRAHIRQRYRDEAVLTVLWNVWQWDPGVWSGFFSGYCHLSPPSCWIYGWF